MPIDVVGLRASIPALQNTIYLNSGGSAPSPRRVLDAMHGYLDRQSLQGPFTQPMLAEEVRTEKALRSTLAQTIGAAAAEITICNNTTDGINLVSGGVDWREGDEVLITDQEHASGLLPWFYLRDRFGIVVKTVTLPADGHGIPELFEAQMTPRTRLVCVSHASWCTGLLLPVREIAAAAHRHGSAVLIDGAQGPGHLPVDVKDLGCDFYALSGQKWLMGPHGSGAFYVSSEAVWQPVPSHLGWASASRVTVGGEYSMHPDGRRYEYATTNHAVLSGLTAALELYLEHGAMDVFERILSLSDTMEAQLRSIPGTEIISPRGAGLSTGLLSFRISGRKPQTIVSVLWEQYRIACRWVDPEAVRLSIHIFNTEDELSTVAKAIQQIAMQ